MYAKKILLLSIYCLMSQVLNAQDKFEQLFKNGIEFRAENIGGKPAFKSFIQNHLIYPPLALQNKTEGEVIISCTINEKGEVLNAKVALSLSPETDAEAMRLFRLLKWKPAIAAYTKKQIATQHEQLFQFNIKTYHKYCKRRGFEKDLFSEQPKDTSGSVFQKAEQMPQYYYGKDSLLKYIQSKLKYPEQARKKNIEGTVLLQFVIETNGKPSNLEAVNSIGGGCVEEAISLMANTLWIPAKMANHYVRCLYSFPITFKLQSNLIDNSTKDQNQQ